MTKKLIYAVVSLVLLFSIFTLSGCEKDDEYVDTGLSAGFKNASSNSEDGPTDFCAYKSDVSEFDIDNVTLHFFYGGIFSESIEHELEHARDIPIVRLYFYNPALGEWDYYPPISEENLYFIREVEENYVSEKYRWKGDQYELEDGYELTIPENLFVGKSGVIDFIVAGDDIRDRVDGYIRISAIAIYYTVDGDRVTLSEKENTSRVSIIWDGSSDL